MTRDVQTVEDLKHQTTEWFASLRDRLCAAFETIEQEAGGPYFDDATEPGRFQRQPWTRDAGGGGTMAMMRGRVFEKVGVHVSVVQGILPHGLYQPPPGKQESQPFWAAGISLIAHPWHPQAPTAHMNTRFIVSTQSWFGGGADLTPMLSARRSQQDPDSLLFHAAMKDACAHNGGSDDYKKYRKWCDEYFFLEHRKEMRGIGGIFFDRLWSGSPQRNFAFVRDVGEAFLGVYPKIVRRNIGKPCSQQERVEQEIQRGRYVEFNLLQDRGTLFGLKMGGNIESILSSLPPRVRWP